MLVGIGISPQIQQNLATSEPVIEPEEFITNGAFAADTDWTKGVGWTIAAGVAANSGTIGILSQTMEAGLQNGNSYSFSIDFVSNSAGVRVVIRVGAQVIYNAIPSAGTAAFTFVSSTTSDVIQISDLDGDGTPGLAIDNISLVPGSLEDDV